MPALSAIRAARGPRGERGASVLYLAPTKALAHDQLAGLASLRLDVRLSAHDGDSSREERDWTRDYAEYVLTNPDMLHRSLLPSHHRWSRLLGSLQYVVVDECHHYRGVFGAHVSHVLRRLRRVCAMYGAHPTFVLASATVAQPEVTASRLTGLDVVALTRDDSPRGRVSLLLWEPPFTSHAGENGAPVRRAASSEVADLLADLVAEDVRTLAFIRSRRGAEQVASTAAELLAEVDPSLPGRVAAYRGGYLPEERRALEAALRRGDLMGLAATNALELGIDISGLDAVLIAGFPGTRAAFWQQVGRAGRGAQDALGMLVAKDDPLDTYLVTHPEMLIGAPVEASVFDPSNPHVMGPHLCAAAQESPLTEADLPLFGPTAREVVDQLVDLGLLRRRPRGWFWTDRGRAADLADIRSAGGSPGAADRGRHRPGGRHRRRRRRAQPGAPGRGLRPPGRDLDGRGPRPRAPRRDDAARRAGLQHHGARGHRHQHRQPPASAGRGAGASSPSARSTSPTRSSPSSSGASRAGRCCRRSRSTCPSARCARRAVWWTVPDDVVAEAGVATLDVPGAAHAAEHCSIGLLPLFATCDRWDIGGVSTARHADTGVLTVFVYDGHPGGAGFSERGFRTAVAWLSATREAIASCECASGCPSCIQSPKCGNQNNPLDKAGAILLLDALLAGAPREG